MAKTTLEDYLEQCESNLRKLESLEMYQRCQEMHDLINSIKERNVANYISLSFDIDGLLKEGFFKKKPTTEQAEKRLVEFFDLESIFHYSLIGGGMLCSFQRDLKNK